MINYYVVKIKTKNKRRTLTKLFKLGIDIFDIKYQKDVVIFKVSYLDYKKIKNIKTLDEINVIRINGIERFKLILKRYRMFFIFFIIGIFIIVFFTRFILFINYETENKEMKELLSTELSNNGITLYSYNKSYKQLEKIKNKIKEENKDKIEWIELEKNGVLLNVKVIERVHKDKKKVSSVATDIVASKNGYIKDIYASSGEIIKNKEDYVQKGDIIVSGNIHRNDNVVARVKSNALVYAEVWYIIKANTNTVLTEEVKNNKGTTSLIINVFDKDLSLFKINKKITNEGNRYILKNNLFKVSVKNKKNTCLNKTTYKDYELISMLRKNITDNMNDTLEEKEYIIEEKVLKNYKENGKMYIEVFLKTYENIAKEQQALEEINEEEN